MKLKLIREEETNDCTLGSLYIDNVFECFTLEDVSRDVKVMHETCIPPGVYKTVITFSQKYQRLMPILLDVPGYSGIRIHSGNRKEDTSGCILVGQTKGFNFIGNSRKAYNALFNKLDIDYTKEEIYIEIIDVPK